MGHKHGWGKESYYSTIQECMDGGLLGRWSLSRKRNPSL